MRIRVPLLPRAGDRGGGPSEHLARRARRRLSLEIDRVSVREQDGFLRGRSLAEPVARRDVPGDPGQHEPVRRGWPSVRHRQVDAEDASSARRVPTIVAVHARGVPAMEYLAQRLRLAARQIETESLVDRGVRGEHAARMPPVVGGEVGVQPDGAWGIVRRPARRTEPRVCRIRYVVDTSESPARDGRNETGDAVGEPLEPVVLRRLERVGRLDNRERVDPAHKVEYSGPSLRRHDQLHGELARRGERERLAIADASASSMRSQLVGWSSPRSRPLRGQSLAMSCRWYSSALADARRQPGMLDGDARSA